MKKDKVFAHKHRPVRPFVFNRDVAEVFDDMLNRSVPLYDECTRRQAQLAARFYQPGSRIYDLGCSHGHLGSAVAGQLDSRDFHMVGVDNSFPMIEKYKTRLKERTQGKRIDLVCAGMEDLIIKEASVVLMNLTLQFLAPERRDAFVSRLYDGMTRGGVLLLAEKTRHSDSEWDEVEQDCHRQFKRENGYSDLEISQKRDALEKVLVPDTVETHVDRLRASGFRQVHTWLKWFNFTAMAAVK